MVGRREPPDHDFAPLTFAYISDLTAYSAVQTTVLPGIAPYQAKRVCALVRLLGISPGQEWLASLEMLPLRCEVQGDDWHRALSADSLHRVVKRMKQVCRSSP